MGVIAVFMTTVVIGASIIGIGCGVVYVIVLLLQGMFYSVGAGQNTSTITIHVDPPKPTNGRNINGIDRGVVQSTPFFEDVIGVDLEYRGVGTPKGGR